MDNERKVTDLIERSKSLFLQEIIQEFAKQQARYDLGKEFAKTRKNRTILVPAVILGMLVVFTAATAVLTFFIRRETNRIVIDISDFADVNLMNILDTAKRYEADLTQTRRELDDLLRRREAEIDETRRGSRRQIDLLSSENLVEAVFQRRRGNILAQERRTVAGIQARYGDRIEILEAEMANIQEKMDQYDRRQLEQAKQQSEVLNNQQRIFDIELENQKTFYETRLATLTDNYERRIAEMESFRRQLEGVLRRRHEQEVQELSDRYNPDLSREAVQTLLEAPVDEELMQDPALAAYRPLLNSEEIISQEEYRQRIDKGVAELRSIVTRLREVPYINSVPQSLRQIDYRMLQLIRDYDALWSGLADRAAEKNEKLDQLLYALDSLASTNREKAYILDPRDEESMVVYVDPWLEIPADALGYVFRRDDQFMGTIQFITASRDEYRIWASLVELDSEGSIMPFDKVLIETRQE